jgi:hypothetical protein
MPRTGGFWSAQIQIDNDRILSVSHDYSFASLVWTSIDLLVWHVGWDVNKIARPGFFAEFQLIAPSHSNSAFYHVKDRLQFSMMMRPSLGIRLNTIVPAQGLLAPALTRVIAAARVMPDVCGVFKSSSSECTILTPCFAQSMRKPLQELCILDTAKFRRAHRLPDLCTR